MVSSPQAAATIARAAMATRVRRRVRKDMIGRLPPGTAKIGRTAAGRLPVRPQAGDELALPVA